MTRALQALTESEEMQQFVAEAHSQRKDVVVEVFQSRNGRPLLIHPNAVPKTFSRRGQPFQGCVRPYLSHSPVVA